MLIVWAADVGAYAFGRLLGRTKLAPAVSPGKTWEGVTGGLLPGRRSPRVSRRPGSTCPSRRLVALGVVTALVSVLGDLTQSMFKRNVGLKDSGKLLPGHGGVLDRIDSLTAAVPVFVGGLWSLRLAADQGTAGVDARGLYSHATPRSRAYGVVPRRPTRPGLEYRP